ncbi:FmdB family zinc ribbon protein [Legionella fairfieldensis]|uniref:FmdB family zinc ribbon protein n=1 Tax=Legionella fairfieldensis TaxID=45064 RepID=UPI00048FF512|nr:zinc ribbon domain-containing protein [Legionella fairfieldensis]
MPIYEYECTSCHHHFDLMQKINDAPVKQCPRCCEDTATRLVSAAGFQLKGSGWYVTDFKNKGRSEHKKETGSDTAVTSEAKPAAKKESESNTSSASKTKGEKE